MTRTPCGVCVALSTQKGMEEMPKKKIREVPMGKATRKKVQQSAKDLNQHQGKGFFGLLFGGMNRKKK